MWSLKSEAATCKTVNNYTFLNSVPTHSSNRYGWIVELFFCVKRGDLAFRYGVCHLVICVSINLSIFLWARSDSAVGTSSDEFFVCTLETPTTNALAMHVSSRDPLKGVIVQMHIRVNCQVGFSLLCSNIMCAILQSFMECNALARLSTQL